MPRDISYGCTGCSLCCRKVGEVIESVKDVENPTPFVKAFKDFPYKADETGACEKLDKDGNCTVYENRPPVCRIPWMFKEFYKPDGVTRKEYYLAEAKKCNELIREHGLDEKYLVNESQYK